MSAGNGDALLQAHQLRQHHGARHDRNVPAACRQNFGIVVLDRGGYDDCIGVAEMLGMAQISRMNLRIGSRCAATRACRVWMSSGVMGVLMRLGSQETGEARQAAPSSGLGKPATL